MKQALGTYVPRPVRTYIHLIVHTIEKKPVCCVDQEVSNHSVVSRIYGHSLKLRRDRGSMRVSFHGFIVCYGMNRPAVGLRCRR